ncbi:ATP phosphoribosyltransferase [Leuconostoc gelidum]|uniref:ATP phosphoribosyltransferase n=1 Tax=Leuconostoc gelidum TaxID=1244 RepID=UPI001C7E0A4B|nr:ATP phosphoribosyltransferase [Leuconostoc gelidum]MBZ6008624.1 ATP phosphoribosyltransferase [Leuconostoc gelidum subsp. aenigmaticum]MBZ6010518.1 ATP phosphoribosyltransferase [Leuconostoc gelidum subsp. aenigmaticum]
MGDKILAAGSHDEFGEALVQKQQITHLISKTLNKKAFVAINTPLIERESVFEQYQHDNVFHLRDQIGENLVLRPDLTLPVARFLASKSQQARVQKFYYIGDVFRRTDYLSGEYNQETQAGIELIGDSSFEAEMQALDIMLDFAQQFEIADVQVVISDTRLIDRVLGTLDISSKQQKLLKQAIESKNMTAFEKVRITIKDFPAHLKRWPLAFGEDGETVMWQLQDLPEVNDLVERWLKLATFIHEHYPDVAVTVDLAAASPQPYYTGTIIRGFVPSLGRYLFSGGRYDRLLESFQTESLPAVGMGFNIDTIMAEWQREAADHNPDEPIVVVLAKGRVEKDTRPLLKSAGIDTTPLENQDRKLVFDSPDGIYRFILVKPDDVVKYLDRGIGDVGIVGSDTIAEQIQNHYDVLNLQTGQAAFVLAAPPNFKIDGIQRKRIATKYPKMASRYFSQHGEDVELVKLSGSVELGPLTGLSDAIIDITQTGDTLRENNLVIYDTVGEVATHLLVRPGALLQFQSELKQVIENLIMLLNQKK